MDEVVQLGTNNRGHRRIGTPTYCSLEGRFYNLCGGQFGNIHQNYIMLIPFDSEIPLEEIYLKNTLAHLGNDLCTILFIATLFVVAKYWE